MMPNDPIPVEVEVAARQQLRILIVDDHQGTQRAIQLLLRWLRCAGDVVSDGREAVEAVRVREYDLILMDVVMPRMDGLEATRRIRAEQSAGSGPWIIGISADATPEDREIGLAAGMDDFLAKPIEVDRLIRALDDAALGLVAAC